MIEAEPDPRRRDDGADLRRLTEQVGDMLSRHTPDGVYTYASPASRKLLGYEPSELVGRRVFELFHPEELELAWDTHQALQRSTQPVTFTHRLRGKDGLYIWCECLLKAEHDPESGEVVGISAVARDISARKAEQEERERQIMELKHALESNRALRGLFPICAQCKNIRDDKGDWQQIERFIRSRSDADFSHSLCPDCAKMLYPDL